MRARKGPLREAGEMGHCRSDPQDPQNLRALNVLSGHCFSLPPAEALRARSSHSLVGELRPRSVPRVKSFLTMGAAPAGQFLEHRGFCWLPYRRIFSVGAIFDSTGASSVFNLGIAGLVTAEGEGSSPAILPPRA